MNPLIKAQLEKVRVATLPEYDEGTTVLHIPKRTASDPLILEQDKCYIIKVEDYILNPPDGFTLHTNWNNNVAPKHKYMKVDVCRVIGKMIKVNSIGYDIDAGTDIPSMWEGWLPEKSITVISRL